MNLPECAGSCAIRAATTSAAACADTSESDARIAARRLVLEEIHVYQKNLKGRRVRFTDEQRRRLSVKAQALGRKTLEQFAGIVTPGTLLELVQEPPRQELPRVCQARSRATQDARQHLRCHGPYCKREPVGVNNSIRNGPPRKKIEYRGLHIQRAGIVSYTVAAN